MFNSILAVTLGSVLGALLRWLASIKLNPLYPALPLGTLTVNLVGGYLIGVAMAVFAQRAEVAPEVRLLVITGFLGGLTTFSSFSAEVVGMLMQNRLGSALAIVMMHVSGSLCMTWLGIQSVKFFIR